MKLFRSINPRLVSMTISVVGLILTIAYGGSLVSYLTVTYYPRPINTLEELANTELPIGSFGSLIKQTFANSPTVSYRKFAERYKIYWSDPQGLKDANEGNLAMLLSRISGVSHSRYVH